MHEAWEDSYIVIYYMDGELQQRTFSNNPDAAEFLQNLTDEYSDFDTAIHAMVIKTEADQYAILSVETKTETRVTIGGY
jgi:hypothetical protein